MKRTHFFLVLIAAVIASSCIQSDEQLTGAVFSENAMVIQGSDTQLQLVKMLASSYMGAHQGIQIAVEGGGSQAGINALISGEAELANSSRRLSRGEILLLKKDQTKSSPVVIANDAVAVITHNRLGVDSLSTLQLSAIYKGRITNWKEVGGPDLPIALYGRTSGSGTNIYFKNHVLTGGNYSPSMKDLQSNTAILEAVKADSTGIGYVSRGYLLIDGMVPVGEVWAMNLFIEGQISHSPFETAPIAAEAYPLRRPLMQFLKGEPTQKLLDFLAFEVSEEGQSIVRASGYLPITDFQQLSNNRVLNPSTVRELDGLK